MIYVIEYDGTLDIAEDVPYKVGTIKDVLEKYPEYMI